MKNELMASLRLVALSAVVCSAAYPLAVWGFAKAVVPEKSQGSLIYRDDGALVGSRLIAQSFTDPKYFWPRPSAVNFDASAAGGSNLSPTNPEITRRVREILARYELPSPAKLPAELVTMSGSGMDPHISLAAAKVQIPRVAAARGISAEELRGLVSQHAGALPLATMEKESIVNVLELNLALDELPRTE
jgi:K+-transporting ATPase ATPase C chain